MTCRLRSGQAVRVAEEEVTETARTEASANDIYSLVSDVTRMGSWSPENIGGRWLDGATGPAVGARFRGSNRRGWRRWSTTCTVVAAEPGRQFAFDVEVDVVPAARWSYELEPEGDTTMVTERWTDHRPAWFARLAGMTMGIADMRAHNRKNIRQTLANLTIAAERRR